MRLSSLGAVTWLRQPEYTGENRCMPCTILNVAMAGAVALLVGVVNPPVGVAFGAISILVIYLRGYLVPGTPQVTERLFPEWVLARFDHHPSFDLEDPEEADLEELLLDLDVVEPCENEDDLCLSEWVRSAARDRIERHRDDPVTRNGSPACSIPRRTRFGALPARGCITRSTGAGRNGPPRRR